MITTCPKCRTAFRVTEEQLGAREGRVRCGKCAEVFDARDTLEFAPGEKFGASASDEGRAREQPVPDLEEAAPAARAAADEPLFRETEAPPRRRILWGLGSGLLVLVLAGQISFHYRGEILLLFPEARPALEKLCSSAGCSLPLPKRAELVSIESSDLQADPANPGVMVLTATLRNRAAFAQSHPALELTLTDLQDQPLARKVLQVRDYVGREANVEAGFQGNSEMPLKIYLEASALKATGYRLYLFYP